MFIVIALVFLVLYAALVFYIGRSSYRWLGPKASSKRFKWIYSIVLAIVASSFFLGQFTDQAFLGVIGAYWMAVFYLLLILVPLAQITVRLLRFTRLPHQRVQAWSGAVVLLLLVSFLTYGIYNAYNPVLRTYEIHIEKDVPSVSSLTVVMAADMHFGLLSGRDHAERLVEEINKLDADLILFPGDVFDDDIRPYVDQGIDEVLSQIESTYGVYASLGNHDRYDGPTEDMIAVLENSNMHVLYDESVVVADSLTLVGRRDHSDDGREELAPLMDGIDLSKPVILLDHQPYDLDIAQEQGIDLMVSGHTHRGQVFPGNLITDAMYENDWGYLQKEQLHSIVTSGYGFWGPPIRIGSRSELVKIDVTFGETTS
ncbi:metallophosphoesterase [Marinicrinis lubricantis]|uniref:Metallophosphoesterase n=1 Tax=Marinicrinis lubricantis TaxID=2086470 RepID=A0ABW1IQB1_9BACL